MLKSIFIEIINPSTKNLIVGPIHRHPCMELSEFNNDFFTSMRKATPWKKKPDSFNEWLQCGLIKIWRWREHCCFSWQIYSTFLIPQITSPTKITRLKTIDIFVTDPNAETLSRNTVTNISDHLAQFLSFPLKQRVCFHKKKNTIYKCDYKNFNVGQFINDLWNINWQVALEINRRETYASFKKFFDIFELLLDSQAPLKKLSCYEAKFYL